MTTVQPIDFGTFNDKDIVAFGLDAGELHFADLARIGALKGDSLFLLVGEIVDAGGGSAQGQFNELGRREIGPNAHTFAEYVGPKTGKLATVVRYDADSIDASHDYGELIPDGPQRWPGGVHHIARVQIGSQWRERTFAAAAVRCAGALRRCGDLVRAACDGRSLGAPAEGAGRRGVKCD